MLAKRVTALIGAHVLVVSVVACSHGNVVDSDGPTCRLSDGDLRLRIPCAWSESIAPGFEGNRPAAWLMAGNFGFPDVYGSKATPSVPRHGVLIVIGDFPLAGRPDAEAWPRVTRLQLPATRLRGRTTSWHVRFGERALVLSATFGSHVTGETVRLVDRAIASARVIH